jgi:exonuclease SbcD
LNKMIKVAHMSDLHYCAKQLKESEKTFGFAVDDAIAREVDCAIISGDSTDHALDAHAPSIEALARQITRLANHCPVLMLQGTFSHEPVGLLRMFSMLGAKYPITVAQRIEVFGLTAKGFESFVDSEQDYRLVVTAFPTLNKADLVAMGRTEMPLSELMNTLLGQFESMNNRLRQRGIPTVLTGHGTVVNSVTESGVPMAGMDHEFGQGAVFSAGMDAVMLGHIHKHQFWQNTGPLGNKQLMAYAGSIGRFHYGEEGDKHYLVWTLEAGNPSFTPVVTPSRVNVELSFVGAPDLEKIRQIAANAKGAFVRVVYSVDEESRSAIDRDAVLAILRDAADVQIVGYTNYVERQRAAGISTEPSIHSKLKKWCELTKTVFDPLEHRVNQLLNQTPQEIVQATMKGIYEIKNTGLVGHDSSNDVVRCEPEGNIVSNDEPERLPELDGLFA